MSRNKIGKVRDRFLILQLSHNIKSVGIQFASARISRK